MNCYDVDEWFLRRLQGFYPSECYFLATGRWPQGSWQEENPDKALAILSRYIKYV